VAFYLRNHRTIVGSYTNDGLTVVLTSCPHDEFGQFRADVEGNYYKTLELVPELAERVRAGRREDRFVGTSSTANFFRKPYGQGWALVGDAGYHKDPSTAQGISDSFRDAELLAEAIDQGSSGRRALEEALSDYERERNLSVMAMYDFTVQLANIAQPPTPQMQQLLFALQGNQEQIDRLLGAWAGTVPIPDFFAPENIERIATAAKR
jgi:2-polyprenyl-6-methoxyphenol hydroxylase-like FAD-dependent oxidoreductase